MKKWKYLKGSASDFVGAPDWAVLRIKGDNEHGHSFIGQLGDIELLASIDGSDGWWEFNPLFKHSVIAQRQLISDDEQDLNECIGQAHIDGNVHSVELGDGNIPALIAERGNRYGKFKDGAEIMRDLKHVMHEVDGWNSLSPSQKEALDMIQHKIGRILNGDPNYDDNWKDVAGYATLIVNELNGEAK